MISTDRELERRDRAALVTALLLAGTSVRGASCRCPFCGDTHPSGSVYQAAGGVWRFSCKRPACGFGGDVYDVRAKAENRPLGEVLPREPRPVGGDGAGEPFHVRAERDAAQVTVYPTLEALTSQLRHVTATYRYTHPDTGTVELAVVRCEPPGERKWFCQCRPQGGGWVQRKPDGRQPLYNRTRVQSAEVVIVVEGEKAVHALTPLLPKSFAATTAPGGSAKGIAENADWSLLAGKLVYLWPDCDPADAKGVRGGLDHMRRVATELERLVPAAQVHWIDPDALGLPPKGDAVEFLGLMDGMADAQKFAAVEAVLEAARPLCPSQDLHQRLLDTIEGRRESVPWPWPHLQRLTKALLPGMLTVLCGGEGGSKSCLAVACCWHWLHHGRRAAYLALEGERADHEQRLLAHLEGNWDVLDDDWARQHGDELLAAYARHRPALDQFAPCVTAPHCARFSRQDALAWLKARCGEGCRVAVIDPVTALMDGGDIWANDTEFVMGARAAATPSGCSVILVTHPRTGSNAKGLSPLEAISGGAAYRRFTDTAIWLQRPKKPVQSVVAGSLGGGMLVRHNLIAHLLKTRWGPGRGLDLAFDFGHSGPSFRELGVIVGDGE